MSLASHDNKDVDSHTGTSTTGHEWDGIRELNTPLPKWWLNIFYATIVWAFFYTLAYPAYPLISDFTKGLLGWSSRAAVTQEIVDLQAMRAPMVQALASASFEQIEKDPKLLAFARAQGKATFGDNCAPCHGSGGGGAKAFPNLVDDDWIWGGKNEDIQATIAHGIRSADPQSRAGNMPAFAGVLKPSEMIAVAEYTRSLSGLAVEKSVDLKIGAQIFADNCSACHGADGRGNQEIGAVNLTDRIWLYGSDQKTILEGIAKGRGGMMPNWNDRLDAGTIKALTVYVRTLGGGR